jgi:DeoR/GlpR family transcriptional regulator of sugar metabolism
MAEQVHEIIVLTESEKFQQQGVEGTVRTEQVSRIFTDDRLAPDKELFLEGRNVMVHKVPSITDRSKPFKHIHNPERDAANYRA